QLDVRQRDGPFRHVGRQARPRRPDLSLDGAERRPVRSRRAGGTARAVIRVIRAGRRAAGAEHHEAKLTLTPPAGSSAAAAISGVAAAAGAPPSQPHRARWEGISLPMQARVLLPPAETDDPAAAAAPVPAPAAAPPPAVITDDSALPPQAAPPPPPQARAPPAVSLADAENFAEELGPAIQHAADKL